MIMLLYPNEKISASNQAAGGRKGGGHRRDCGGLWFLGIGKAASRVCGGCDVFMPAAGAMLAGMQLCGQQGGD
jgi:hypothetical protein